MEEPLMSENASSSSTVCSRLVVVPLEQLSGCLEQHQRVISPVHKMLEVQSLYKPTPLHQPTVKRRRLRLTSVPLVNLRAPSVGEGALDGVDLYGSLNSPPRSLMSDADSLSIKSGVCSMSESMDSQRFGSSRIKHMASSWETESRFPKLNECAHFHYEFVELGPINVCLYDEQQHATSKAQASGETDHGVNFSVQVSSNGKSWVVRRSYDNFHMLDRQLHQCVYDRKFSALPEISKENRFLQGDDDYSQTSKENIKVVLSEYLHRFSDIAGNLISCGPILNWLELDNRGNRLIVTDDSAINTPAVAAAYVTKRYTAQANDEISFEVGDMISVIDMPPSDESIWWRGKRGFEVGFFPSECVEVIGDKVPHTIHIPKAPTKPVLRKHGKLIAFFRSFILSRPSRRKLKQSGILKERVFGCDLGEHLLNSGHDIPMVLKCCADFIEGHGIVDGIYRLSGVTSNIQKLRNTFDEDRVPELNVESILQDIHSVASLLKMYFRELPNPLLTYQLYDKFVASVQSDEDVRLLNVRDVVQQLPPPHYRTLEYLVKHLARVAAHGADTGMTPKNVAIVWAPNLLRSKDLEVGGVAALQVVGVQAVVTEFLIHYCDLIFNDKMPSFPSSFGPTVGGTPKRNRPKSLAISTPTKLLSLEEARTRALCTGTQYSQKYIEVGGGPATLPSKYHTVIDLPDRKRGSTKHKKSPSGWKSFFSKGRSSSHNSRDREKNPRKASTTPSDPGTSLNLNDKAVTEVDVLRNSGSSRLRSVKSAESLISSSAASSHRNSEVIESGVPVTNGCRSTGQAEEKGEIMSSSLGAVPSSQRHSPHSHIRSVSHDSYFEFTLDRRREEEHKSTELSTILSEDNDDDSNGKLIMDDFRDVAADMDFMKISYADQEGDFSLIGHMDDITGSATVDETSISLTDGMMDSDVVPRSVEPLPLPKDETNSDPESSAGDALHDQLSFDFEDEPCDIVGDIQQEVAAALHWDHDTLSILPPEQNHVDCLQQDAFTVPRKPLPPAVIEVVAFPADAGTKKTVAEVFGTADVSPNESRAVKFEEEKVFVMHGDEVSDVLNEGSELRLKPAVPASGDRHTPVLSEDGSSPCVAESDSSDLVCVDDTTLPPEFASVCEMNSLVSLLAETGKSGSGRVSDGGVEADYVLSDWQNCEQLLNELVQKTCSDILPEVRECIVLPENDEHKVFPQPKAKNAPNPTFQCAEDDSFIDLVGSDLSPASHHASSRGHSSAASPVTALQDPFGYTVLTNEDDLTPQTPLHSLAVEELRQEEQHNADASSSSSLVVVEDVVASLVNSVAEGRMVENRLTLPDISVTCPTVQFSSSDSENVPDFPYAFVASSDDTIMSSSCDASPSFVVPPPCSIPASAATMPMSVSVPATPTACELGGLFAPHRSCSFSDKLSLIDDNRRRFESEIGRDILRERKVKLEMERIQLEKQQQLQKPLSPLVGSVPEDGESWEPSDDGQLENDVGSGGVGQLRRAQCDDDDDLEVFGTSSVELSKQLPEQPPAAASGPQQQQQAADGKRHSESTVGKCLRPERKASVRELMSKFEGGRPKVEVRNVQAKESLSDTEVTDAHDAITEPKREDLSPEITDRSQELGNPKEPPKQLCLPLPLPSTPPNLRRESAEAVHDETATSKKLDSPTSEGAGKNLATCDLARRERIDRYKEERRAQLREQIRADSFRGEHDGHGEYLLKLKQKGASPTNLCEVGGVNESGGSGQLPPVSPRRRSRLSYASGSPVEDKAGDIPPMASHRHSTSALRSYEPTSPNGLRTPPPSPSRKSTNKGSVPPPPPPSTSPRKVLSLVEANIANDSSEIYNRPSSQSVSSCPLHINNNRPRDLPLDGGKSMTHATAASHNKTLSPRKGGGEVCSDLSSRKLRSPARERFGLVTGGGREESQNSPGVPLPPSLSSVEKCRGPPLRKIKDVAAMFEQDSVGSSENPVPKSHSVSGNILPRQSSQESKKSRVPVSVGTSSSSWKAKYTSGP